MLVELILLQIETLNINLINHYKNIAHKNEAEVADGVAEVH